MCNIVGWYFKNNKKEFNKRVRRILDSSYTRGKDSFGFIDTKQGQFKYIGNYCDIDYKIRNKWNFEIGIANFRAEPTTEYCQEKTFEDVQPFNYEKISAIHNGIISNDTILRELYSIPTKTKIDSSVIPFMFHHYGKSAFQLMKGSMAIACLKDRSIYLYRNYNPIWMYEDKWGNVYFASLEEQLPIGAWEIPPYSYTVIGKNKYGINIINSKDPRPNADKAVVICSGGLDSVTTAYWAKKIDKKDITLIHFRYGCKAQSREQLAILKIAEDLNCKVEFFDIDFLKKLGGSPIIDGGEIAKNEDGVEVAHEWVPARNTLFLGMVAAYCDRYKISDIYMGLNLEESGSYPDNSIDFYHFMEKAFNVGTISRPRLYAPFINSVKHEIVETAVNLGVPVELTWSCYKNEEKQCGECGPCYMRKKAFEMNGLEDPTEYMK